MQVYKITFITLSFSRHQTGFLDTLSGTTSDLWTTLWKKIVLAKCYWLSVMAVYQAGAGSNYDPGHGGPSCTIWNPGAWAHMVNGEFESYPWGSGRKFQSLIKGRERSEESPKGQDKKLSFGILFVSNRHSPGIYSLPSTLFCTIHRNKSDSVSPFYINYETICTLQSHDKMWCHMRKGYGDVGGNSRVRGLRKGFVEQEAFKISLKGRNLDRWGWKRGKHSPQRRWVAELTGSKISAVTWRQHHKVLSSQPWKQMDGVQKEQSSPLYPGEYSSWVGQANVLDPDMANSAASRIFPILGRNWGHQARGQSVWHLKITSPEKERRTKIKNSPTHQQDRKGARMFPFRINKNLQTMPLRETFTVESHSCRVHPGP